MITVSAILDSIDNQELARACGIGISNIYQWRKRGVPSRHIDVVAKMALLQPHHVRNALTNTEKVNLDNAGICADEIIFEWGRGTEKKLHELITTELIQAFEAGREHRKYFEVKK